MPVILANTDAFEKSLEQVQRMVEGKDWVQEPFPNQAKCLQWLRIEYAKLDDEARQKIDSILAGTGCEKLVAKPVTD